MQFAAGYRDFCAQGCRGSGGPIFDSVVSGVCKTTSRRASKITRRTDGVYVTDVF